MNLCDPIEMNPIGRTDTFKREMPYCLICGGSVGIGNGECTFKCKAYGEPRTDTNTIMIVSDVTWVVAAYKPFSQRIRYGQP